MKISKKRIAEHFVGQIEKLANAAAFVDDMHALLTGGTSTRGKLNAADELLDAYGIESACGTTPAGYSVSVVYVNMGDTYAATVVWDVNGKLRLTTMGDAIEHAERNGCKFD
jgi:hypothetical protein